MRKRREGVAAATADPAYYMRSPPAISAVPFHYLLIFKISLSSSTKSVQRRDSFFWGDFPNSAEVWSSAVTLSLFVTFCFCLCVLRRAALVCIIILSVFRPPLCQTSSARWHCRHLGLGRVQVFFTKHFCMIPGSWWTIHFLIFVALGDNWTVLRKTHCILCILGPWVEWWPN